MRVKSHQLSLSFGPGLMYSGMTASVIYSAVYVSAGQVEKPFFFFYFAT